MKNKTTIKTETIFLFLSLIFGLLFATCNPPFGEWDAGTHINKAYDVSEGNIFPKDPSFMVPLNLKRGIDQPINNNGVVNANLFGQTIYTYPPLPYLASALIIKFGEFFNLSYIMYMCRIINLLIYTLIVYFAIKFTPILKTTLLLIALMPTTMFSAASVSGDSLTIALSFLAIALFLNLSLIKNKMRMKNIIIIFIVSLTLSLTKPSYSLLSLLFFMIPYNKFQNIKNWIISFICSCLIPLAISFIWNAKFNIVDGYNLYRGCYVYNTTFILSHPYNVTDILINTITNTNFIVDTLHQFVFNSGHELILPPTLIYAYLIVLVLVSLFNISGFKLNLKQKIIGSSVFLIICLAISVAELITWTPIGHNIIEGVQGRYFIPITPLLFLVFNNSLNNRRLQKIYEKFNWKNHK